VLLGGEKDVDEIAKRKRGKKRRNDRFLAEPDPWDVGGGWSSLSGKKKGKRGLFHRGCTNRKKKRHVPSSCREPAVLLGERKKKKKKSGGGGQMSGRESYEKSRNSARFQCTEKKRGGNLKNRFRERKKGGGGGGEGALDLVQGVTKAPLTSRKKSGGCESGEGKNLGHGDWEKKGCLFSSKKGGNKHSKPATPRKRKKSQLLL